MRQIQDENQAVKRLNRGDLDAFNFLYRKYSGPVFRNICKFVRNETVAEDILQEVFLRFWEHRFAFDPNRSVGGWLFRVSYHASLKALDRKQREPVVHTDYGKIIALSPAAAAYDESDYQDMIELLEEAVNQLPVKKQKVFRLYRMENKKPEEISEELGLTVVSVKDYLKQSTRMVKHYIHGKSAAEISMFLLMIGFTC